MDNWESVKRPSHGKLKLANSCWQTQVGVCERRKNSRQTRYICHQQFADCFCAVHTHQLEFANTSLPTLVCRVKATLDFSSLRVNSINLLQTDPEGRIGDYYMSTIVRAL